MGPQQRLTTADEAFKSTRAYCCYGKRCFHRYQGQGKEKKMPRRKKNQTHLSACFPFYIPQKVPGEKWVQLIPLSLSVGLFTDCPLALF